MRKLILFFIAVSFGLTMTSCLDDGVDRLSGEREYFYITQMDDGLQVATIGNFLITSTQIKAEQPDRWYRITWSWATENGMAATNVHNAITPQIEQIPTGSLIHQEAPNEISAPALNFTMIDGLPLTNFYGDYLIFRYSWNKKESEKVHFKLYNSVNEINISNTITLDVRLVKSGNSTETSGKIVEEEAIVKMSELRNLISFAGEDYKDIMLKFNYYKTNTEQVTTNSYQIKVFKD